MPPQQTKPRPDAVLVEWGFLRACYLLEHGNRVQDARAACGVGAWCVMAYINNSIAKESSILKPGRTLFFDIRP